MTQLVDRYGRTGFAALSSVIWALPMAAWAGSFDLSPMDKTAFPWIAFAIGVAMLVVWLVVLTRLRSVTVTQRQHRLDFAQMSKTERRWSLALAVFALGAIAWLNAAATVDWGPLVSAVSRGTAGPTAFAVALAAFLIVMLAGVYLTWKKEAAAFAQRVAAKSAKPEPPPSDREAR